MSRIGTETKRKLWETGVSSLGYAFDVRNDTRTIEMARIADQARRRGRLHRVHPPERRGVD